MPNGSRRVKNKRWLQKVRISVQMGHARGSLHGWSNGSLMFRNFFQRKRSPNLLLLNLEKGLPGSHLLKRPGAS